MTVQWHSVMIVTYPDICNKGIIGNCTFTKCVYSFDRYMEKKIKIIKETGIHVFHGLEIQGTDAWHHIHGLMRHNEPN